MNGANVDLASFLSHQTSPFLYSSNTVALASVPSLPLYSAVEYNGLTFVSLKTSSSLRLSFFLFLFYLSLALGLGMLCFNALSSVKTKDQRSRSHNTNQATGRTFSQVESGSLSLATLSLAALPSPSNTVAIHHSRVCYIEYIAGKEARIVAARRRRRG
jgi:hypothetical protein